MIAVRNRLLLCTSPLQIINARSAMQSMETPKDAIYKDYVLIIHPLLNSKSKSQIVDLAKSYEYSETFDATFLVEELINEPSGKFVSGIKNGISIQKLSKRRLSMFKDTVSKVANYIGCEIGTVDEVFVRLSYKRVDLVFYHALHNVKVWYGIEDGIGNYLPRGWKWTRLNWSEISFQVRHIIRTYLVFWLTIMTTAEWSLAVKRYFRQQIVFDKCFLNLTSKYGHCVGQYFKTNIEKKYVRDKLDKEKKVIIIGTRISTARHPFSIVDETKIYNNVIEIIVRRHDVNRNEIWYKPHPRVRYEDWLYKKEYLECRIYEFEDVTLAETELLNPEVCAVYSAGSTALLYAQTIFGVPAFLIALPKGRVHPSIYKKYLTVLNKFRATSPAL